MKVLLVDDSGINSASMTVILKNLNITDVIKSKNGSEALKIIPKHDFDLVFMDINMPGLSGIETTHLISDFYKSLNKQGPKIIGLSSNPFSDIVNECLNAGMNDYLRKPPMLEAVRKIIQKHFPVV